MKYPSTAGFGTGKWTTLLSGFCLACASVLMNAPASAETVPSAKSDTVSTQTDDKSKQANQKNRPKPTPAKVSQPSPPECQRVGQRVIAALARDDTGAALQFHTFYTTFNCSEQELTQAFGCLVNLQTAVPSLSNPSPQQVAECWADPTKLPEVPTPAPQKQGGESGGKT